MIPRHIFCFRFHDFLTIFAVYRLTRFLETASSVLNYFQPFLGRIEILGGSKRIERVYFEIKESNIEQWLKPQIRVRCVILLGREFKTIVSYAIYTH